MGKVGGDFPISKYGCAFPESIYCVLYKNKWAMFFQHVVIAILLLEIIHPLQLTPSSLHSSFLPPSFLPPSSLLPPYLLPPSLHPGM